MKRLFRATVVAGTILLFAVAAPAAALAAPPGHHGNRHHGRGGHRHHVHHREVVRVATPIYRPVVVPAYPYAVQPLPIAPAYGFGYSSPGFSFWFGR